MSESSSDYSPYSLPLKKRGGPLRGRNTQASAEAAPLMLNIFTHQPYGALSPHLGSALQRPWPTPVAPGAVRRASLSLSGSEASQSAAAAVLALGEGPVRGASGDYRAGTSGPGVPGQGGKQVPVLKHRQKSGASSAFRGVTRHSTTGRYEAHLWDSSSIRPKSVRDILIFQTALSSALAVHHTEQAPGSGTLIPRRDL